MSALTRDSILDVSHLSIQEDGDEYTVGDLATENFIRIPYEGVAALRLLDGTRTLGEAEAYLLESEGIEVDFLDFGETLLEMELVRSLDGVITSTAQEAAGVAIPRWQVAVGRMLFGKVAVVLYILFALSSAGLMIWRPELFPHYEDTFAVSAVGLSMLLVFVTNWILILLHEFAHMFAANAVGVPVRIRFSVRWLWMVMEAEMTGLWAFPRKLRYVPFLAGIFFEVTVMLAVLLLQFWLPAGGFLHAVCQLIALILLYQLLTQLMIFIRTDLYFVLITATNAADLSGDAKLFLRHAVLRVKAATQAFRALSARQQQQATWFGLLYGVAFLVVVFLFARFLLPTTVETVTRAWNEVVGTNASDAVFWDGMIVIGLTAVQFVAWVVVSWRRYRGNRAQKNLRAM